MKCIQNSYRQLRLVLFPSSARFITNADIVNLMEEKQILRAGLLRVKLIIDMKDR